MFRRAGYVRLKKKHGFRKPKLWSNLPEWTVVAGEVKGDVTAKRVFLLIIDGYFFLFLGWVRRLVRGRL